MPEEADKAIEKCFGFSSGHKMVLGTRHIHTHTSQAPAAKHIKFISYSMFKYLKSFNNNAGPDTVVVFLSPKNELLKLFLSFLVHNNSSIKT